MQVQWGNVIVAVTVCLTIAILGFKYGHKLLPHEDKKGKVLNQDEKG